MNFPQFWAKAESGGFICWRWSSASIAEAKSLADQAAQKLAERFRANGSLPNRLNGGYYPDRPPREQILREIKNDANETTALVTRNSYGCLVLNTDRVMFVDIDLPEPKSSGGFFKSLFGKPAPPSENPAQSAAVSKVENWTRNQSDWGWRIYRTRAGLRLLATQGTVEANSDAVAGVFTALGADPLYQKLCKTQKCFRARLTPKPWRCGIMEKPDRWPWQDANAESQFQRWEKEYLHSASGWATCELLRQIGNATVHPEVARIVTVHDEVTRAESRLQLA